MTHNKMRARRPIEPNSLSAPLSLERERREALAMLRAKMESWPYVGSYWLNRRPSLVPELIKPLNDELLGLDEQLAELRAELVIEGSNRFHELDPIRRLDSKAQERLLLKRALKRARARLKRSAAEHEREVKALRGRDEGVEMIKSSEQGPELERQLREFVRQSLSPKLSTARWAELIILDLEQSHQDESALSDELLEELRERLLQPLPFIDSKLERQDLLLTEWMRALHRVAWCEPLESLQRRLSYQQPYRSHFKHLNSLLERVKRLAREGSLSSDELKELCLRACYLLADQQRREERLFLIAYHREELLRDIQQELNAKRQAKRALRELFGSGLFAERALRELELNRRLQKQLCELSEKKSYRELLKRLGRMRELDQEALARRVSVEETRLEYLKELSDERREELVGVKAGDELARLLPSELSLLGELDEGGQGGPEEAELLELLFYQRLSEKSLQVYELSGFEERARREQREVELELPSVTRGPYILCVDSSASMRGEQEQLAKCLALNLASRALREGRACYLLQFSDHHVGIDLTKEGGAAALMNFITMSFSGGTDLDSSLECIHELINEQEGSYQSADLLVISDFEIPEPSRENLREMRRLQGRGVRYYGVATKDRFGSMDFTQRLDQLWVLRSGSELCLEELFAERRSSPLAQTTQVERSLASL